MRRERAPGMDVPVMVVDRPTDEEEEHAAVFRVEKERLATVRLSGDVIDRAGLLDPSGTAHLTTVAMLAHGEPVVERSLRCRREGPVRCLAPDRYSSATSESTEAPGRRRVAAP